MTPDERRKLIQEIAEQREELRKRRAEHDKAACEDLECELCETVREDYDAQQERLAAHGDYLYDCWKDSR